MDENGAPQSMDEALRFIAENGFRGGVTFALEEVVKAIDGARAKIEGPLDGRLALKAARDWCEVWRLECLLK